MMHRPVSDGPRGIDLDAPIEHNATMALAEVEQHVKGTRELRRRLQVHREAVMQLLNRLDDHIALLPNYDASEATVERAPNGVDRFPPAMPLPRQRH